MKSEHARRILNFQQIKQVPLTAVLERYGRLGEMKRIGAQLFGTCPIHRGSNKKQFVVDPAKNVWKCFGDCDRGGSTIELVSGIENIETRAAAELIAQWFAIGSSNHTSNHRNQRRRKSMSGEKPSHKAFVVEDRGEGEKDCVLDAGADPRGRTRMARACNVQIASGFADVRPDRLASSTPRRTTKEEDEQKAKRKK